MIELSKLINGKRKILVTGGAGFIGSTLIRRLLVETDSIIFNLDKIGYSSDLSSINKLISNKKEELSDRYSLLKVDLKDYSNTSDAIKEADPDIIFHLAAESHVDRSIDSPSAFINNNIVGTYNLLQASLIYFESLKRDNKDNFRFHHISTDEVYGSLGEKGSFNEGTKYDPRSPYSASKAASDHLVNAWFHTYSFPIIVTNCSNNFGPWQFPEKLIPLTILKAISNKNIPLYGNGTNIRDWLYVEDHIDALILSVIKGEIGKSYCIGGYGEKSNIEVVNKICEYLDKKIPKSLSYKEQIKFVNDRPGHDWRYSIDSTLITKELGWRPKNTFNEALFKTIQWYLDNQDWCIKVQEKSGYNGERLGVKVLNHKHKNNQRPK